MDPSLRPMLCEKLAEYAVDIPDQDPRWTMEAKLDGHRMIVHRTHITALGIADVHSYTRSGGDMTAQIPYIEDELGLLLPPDTVVDGELVYIKDNGDGTITSDRGYVMTATRSNTPHRIHAHAPALAYIVFDVLRIGGVDARGNPWHERRAALERLWGERDLETFAAASDDTYFTALSQRFPYSRDGRNALIAVGFEGVVVKAVDSKYRAGKSWDWLKDKASDTEDCEIIGMYDATAGSKYEGNAVGGICFRTEWGYEGRVGSGIPDDLRRDLYQRPDHYVGKTVEIEHRGRQESGALLNPVFMFIRDDKTVRTQRPEPKRRKSASKQTRNRAYGQMKDDKLLRVYGELQTPGSESYEKVVDPEGDLLKVRALIADRGLEVPA